MRHISDGESSVKARSIPRLYLTLREKVCVNTENIKLHQFIEGLQTQV